VRSRLIPGVSRLRDSKERLMDDVLELALGQLLALVTFFAFPAIQYISLKRLASREGEPQLWYLPKYGFRLVIHNISRKRVLSEIKYRAQLRMVIPSSPGSSVATFKDVPLIEREDFFLFPGTDQVLLCFRLEGSPENPEFVLTDKLGSEQQRVALSGFDRLLCDYVATVENLFNFDIKVARRIEIKTKTLGTIMSNNDGQERQFSIDRIRAVG
jgi:hypothetical protein